MFTITYLVHFYLLIISLTFANLPTERNDTDLKKVFTPTRRVLAGKEVYDTRPYMVYLRPAPNVEGKLDSNWLCGGVILEKQYILTSAACINDAKHFYVISGTHRWISSDQSDDCVINGGKKAIWKCVPKSYIFDGNEFDNIQWMINDIAVVKVEDEFNFEKRVKGCDFIPNKISFNNISDDVEKPGTVASVAGWGSINSFPNNVIKTSINSRILLEADVVIISKKNCKKRWEERYHYIIDDTMICSKDTLEDSMSLACREKEVNCQEIDYSDEEHDDTRRDFSNKTIGRENNLELRRSKPKVVTGGFCENDHGGPLVVGYGKSAVVVGIISACLTKNITNKCHGPFLYTSVWKNRDLIYCAIDKNIAASCKKLLRNTKTEMEETTFDWNKHADGPPPTTRSSNHRILRNTRLRSVIEKNVKNKVITRSKTSKTRKVLDKTKYLYF